MCSRSSERKSSGTSAKSMSAESGLFIDVTGLEILSCFVSALRLESDTVYPTQRQLFCFGETLTDADSADDLV